MIKQISIELKPEQINNDALIRKIAARKCKIIENDIKAIKYIKRSLDARSSKPKYLLNMNVFIGEFSPNTDESYHNLKYVDSSSKKVIIIGAGPAGLFAALELLKFGIKPIICERGKDIRNRRKDLKLIMQKGVINPNSNYCFGEGGAGSYSDGKLFTRSHKKGIVYNILQALVHFGASQDILIDAHPHIGSDLLPKVIESMRNIIVDKGGELHLSAIIDDILIKDGYAIGVHTADGRELVGEAVILATGHSAKDIYYLLSSKGLALKCKAYAIGFRIEHEQELINEIQYGTQASCLLPPAEYKLAVQVNGVGVYTFCMCPGGIIVPSATYSNELVVNGMSMSRRGGRFANSGIVTSVDGNDFKEYSRYGELAGLEFRNEIERKFYLGCEENLLKAPAQRLIDYISGKTSISLHESSYIPGLQSCELHRMLPWQIAERLRLGLRSFGKKMRGFITFESNLIGLESRTSSPVRIPRNAENFEHIQIRNLYPCGEGSGYAGGIISSAIDGQNAAKMICKKLNLF